MDSCTIITAVHTSCSSKVLPTALKTPLCTLPSTIRSFLWEPFNRHEHSLYLGWDDINFNKDNGCKMIVSVPCPADVSALRRVKILYHLHCNNKDCSILAGTLVLYLGSLCPPFESCSNQNLFQLYFGIEFHHDNLTFIWPTSMYKFARCFGLCEIIQYPLSHEKHKFGLDASMPGRSSAWLFEQVHLHLLLIQDEISEVFSPNQFAAPAATIQMLVNVPFVHAFLLKIIGSRPTTAVENSALHMISFSTHQRYLMSHYPRSTTTIAARYKNCLSVSRIGC